MNKFLLLKLSVTIAIVFLST